MSVVEPAWRWRCSCSTRTRTTRPGRAPGAVFHVQTSLRKAGASKECDSGRVRHFSPAGQPPSSVRTTPHRSPARLTACKCTPSHQRFHPVDILSHIAMQKIAIPMKNNPCEAPMLPKPRYPYPYPNPDPNPNPNPDPDPDPDPNPNPDPDPAVTLPYAMHNTCVVLSGIFHTLRVVSGWQNAQAFRSCPLAQAPHRDALNHAQPQ